jgi:hypothetical protein
MLMADGWQYVARTLSFADTTFRIMQTETSEDFCLTYNCTLPHRSLRPLLKSQSWWGRPLMMCPPTMPVLNLLAPYCFFFVCSLHGDLVSGARSHGPGKH